MTLAVAAIALTIASLAAAVIICVRWLPKVEDDDERWLGI